MKFWLNILENIIYITIVAVAITVSNYFIIQAQQDTIIEAINKQTTSITNEFQKVKTNKGEINLQLNSTAKTSIDTTTINKKRFFNFLHRKK
jgi:hypothetical protein